MINKITPKYSGGKLLDNSQLIIDKISEIIDYLNEVGNTTSYTYKTSSYQVKKSDCTIECSGTFTVTLIDSNICKGKIFNIKNSGTGTITVNTVKSQTMDGEITIDVETPDNMLLQSVGSNWKIL